ncbi:MAG: Fic family protein [Verrucomicrobiota bacterium]|jgi:Fic family protein|nr:Fic family protein [Verrucomicrobiota bacterium]
MSDYTPPYSITEKMNNLTVGIAERLAYLQLSPDTEVNLLLRKNNRIRSIHSSLAIENNSLSLEQVSDVINGKRVFGKPAEILEVKNACQAYAALGDYAPYKAKDFLAAHQTLMRGLVERPGHFRTSGVGVFAGTRLIHAAPPAKLIHSHINDLFGWAKKSKAHPLIKSSVMHYEIEFIHPFLDGNGRMGRLWQAVVLAQWNALFAWIPVESIVLANQSGYYDAIGQANRLAESTPFVEFMLDVILTAVNAEGKHQDKHQDEHQVTGPQKTLLKALRKTPQGRKELLAVLGLQYDFRAYKRHIAPLLDAGLLEMTVPDKPNSKLQKYRLTAKGRAFASV